MLAVCALVSKGLAAPLCARVYHPAAYTVALKAKCRCENKAARLACKVVGGQRQLGPGAGALVALATPHVAKLLVAARAHPGGSGRRAGTQGRVARTICLGAKL